MKKFVMALAICLLIAGCKQSNEYANYNARIKQVDYNPNLVGYITCINRTGQVVFSGIIKGKVTRSEGDNVGYYIYWFDSKGRYHQWNGEYFYTDYPLNLVVDPILIEIVGSNSNYTYGTFRNFCIKQVEALRKHLLGGEE